jgi:hypothetical protein
VGGEGRGQGQKQEECVRANEDALLAVRNVIFKWLLVAVNDNKLANDTHNGVAFQNEVRGEGITMK